MDDDAPINPYESPRSGPETEQFLPGPDRVYGLGEPIRAQGTLAPEDYWEKPETTSKKPQTAFYVLLALVTFAVMGLNLLGRSVPPAPGVMMTLLVPIGLVVLAILLLLFICRRNFRRHVEQTAVRETATFTEEGIVVEADEGRGAFSWSAFCACKCSEHRVLLYREPNGDHIIYPKRFFAGEDDWNRFLGLVRCKLPEDDQLDRPPTERARRDLPCREGDEPLLRLSGAITWRDWKEIRRRIGRLWLGRLAGMGCFSVIAIAGVALFFRSGPGAAWTGLLALAVAVVMFFYLAVVAPAVKLRRQWKRGEGPFGPYEVRLWDDALESVAPTSVATIPWTAFDRFTRSDTLLLLHQDKLRVFRFIPRSLCPSDDAWQTLLRLVSERVEEG